MTGSKEGAHILVIPFPAQGHILPLLDLTHLLANRGGLTITIMVTPKVLPILNPLLSLNPSIQTLVIPFPNHPSIPNGVENMQDLPLDLALEMMCAMCALYNPVLHWFQAHQSPPLAIISDILHSYWTQSLAVHLGIKRLGFSPMNTAALSLFSAGTLSNRNKSNSSSLNSVDFVNVDRREIFPKCFSANADSWGMIVNSFTDLEGEQLENLKKDIMGHDRVWPVGPLLRIQDLTGPSEHGGPKSNEVLAWLDSCEVDNSVVYVGFGTQVTLTNQQMEMLAKALEDSKVRFIWTVKEPIKDLAAQAQNYCVVPTGFEDRVAGRGVVIKGWASQVAILGHRTVGAFLTHCGWNSSQEGLLNEVLLLAWPMGPEHIFTGKLLVDQLGIAIKVCEGLDAIPDLASLARVLADSVSGNPLPERVRAMELRKKALDAIKEGGSSYKAFDDLVKQLFELKSK